MRLVLDTNILISACWKPGGLEDRVVQMGFDGELQFVATPAVWDEYVEVLSRPKFNHLRDRIDSLLSRLRPAIEIVPAGSTIELASDPDDNLLLEAASAASAEFLLTGNLRDYPLDWPVARILNARQFLDLVQIDGLGGAVIKPIE